MSAPAVFLRRARIRNMKEGLIQSGRMEATEFDTKDGAERPQDYGFAANVVDGQGLVITVDGTTIILRADRLAERPELAAHEVTVWHKEGHKITMRAGKLIEVDCDTYRVNAAVKVEYNTPLVTGTGNMTMQGRVTGAAGVTAAGKNLEGHTHPDITSGGNTGSNN